MPAPSGIYFYAEGYNKTKGGRVLPSSLFGVREFQMLPLPQQYFIFATWWPYIPYLGQPQVSMPIQ
jgi:hypothetical protein